MLREGLQGPLQPSAQNIRFPTPSLHQWGTGCFSLPLDSLPLACFQPRQGQFICAAQMLRNEEKRVQQERRG